MKSIEDLTIKKDSTIIDAMQTIQRGNIKLALIIDNDFRLIGTLSDGDIRRALLQKYNLDDTIEEIINKEPTTCFVNTPIDKIIQIADAKKLHQIPIIDNDGKLVGIEDIDDLKYPKIKTNSVILMVGGLGTRLKPLTNNVPKPMLKVGNKPILETIIDNFSKYGFKNIILSVNYKSKMIEDYFKDGKEFGVNIEYIHEDKRMGTAGALTLLKNRPKEPFFVMNGDLLTNVNFEHMLEFHNKIDAEATVCIREITTQIPYGVVNIDKYNKIVSIEEKPIHSYYVSGGIYILNPTTIDLIPNNEYYDIPTLFDSLIKQDRKLHSYINDGYWLDIGHIHDYQKANIEYEDIF